jgi:hypothetical protein
MKQNTTVHLLLRFSDMLLKEGDTIREHNKLVQSDGAVWFGKMGATVSDTSISSLNQQIEDNIPTYVYLVKGNRKKPSSFRAELIIASKELPKNEFLLVPSYYKNLNILEFIHFWVKIKEIIPQQFADLEKMRVVSSVFPLPETLVRSSCGHFLIRENNLLF